MIKIIHDVTTGEITEIELTEKEIEMMEKQSLEFQNDLAKNEEKLIAKAELLNRLGISEAEAALLFS